MPEKNPHEFMSRDWYRWTHDQHEEIHRMFCRWVSERAGEIDAVLEIGCGKHDFYHHFFAGMAYAGMDISGQVVDYCRDNHIKIGTHTYVRGDFLGCNFYSYHPDLVFSHAVIDHSPDPTAFVKRSVELAKHYVYHKTYRGYFDDIETHRQDPPGNPLDKDFYVDVSVRELARVLTEMREAGQLNAFWLKPVATGRPKKEIDTELHIIVEK